MLKSPCYYINLPTDQLDTTIQEPTGHTPYELVFRQAPRHGLNIEATAGIITEEDAQDIVETSSGMGDPHCM